ncbi:DUF4331 family protein [Streptomyces sp. TS71-3]|uniref:DUF4331 family protein n=1 Tax=Streptomyces sp. TS71-3 TaxID=2733862 RepID=UPI001BB43364|nr:DUF4331 family protein [Streptomyces sp. TS71-3]
MSHHLDSPLARQDVRLDITDLYVFRGETGTVFVLDVCPSAAGEDAPKGFHPEARYEFRIDVNDDGVEELTYRFAYGAPDASGRQEVRLYRLTGADAADPAAEGTLLVKGATGTPVVGEGGLRVWAGRAHDPFWIEPTVLGAIGEAFANGTRVDLSGWDPARARNAFADNEIYATVLEIPDRVLLDATGDELRIEVWALASLATDAGGWRPVNRAGIPMVHPLFAQHDDDLGDRLNVTLPGDDMDHYGESVADMVAAVVAAHGSAQNPRAHGVAVAERICPNQLPYIIGTPAEFGFAGWNGRSLTDNAPEVMFSLATNTACTIGLDQTAVPVRPTAGFPYVHPVA